MLKEIVLWFHPLLHHLVWLECLFVLLNCEFFAGSIYQGNIHVCDFDSNLGVDTLDNHCNRYATSCSLLVLLLLGRTSQRGIESSVVHQETWSETSAPHLGWPCVVVNIYEFFNVRDYICGIFSWKDRHVSTTLTLLRLTYPGTRSENCFRVK